MTNIVIFVGLLALYVGLWNHSHSIDRATEQLKRIADTLESVIR
jgi:hypothetical protein